MESSETNELWEKICQLPYCGQVGLLLGLVERIDYTTISRQEFVVSTNKMYD